jgi:hypothetical protein
VGRLSNVSGSIGMVVIYHKFAQSLQSFFNQAEHLAGQKRSCNSQIGFSTMTWESHLLY